MGFYSLFIEAMLQGLFREEREAELPDLLGWPTSSSPEQPQIRPAPDPCNTLLWHSRHPSWLNPFSCTQHRHCNLDDCCGHHPGYHKGCCL
jgi:hypothetical protein